MSDEVTKEDIIKSLEEHIDNIKVIVRNLTMLDTTDDDRVNRTCVHNATFTLFELIDKLVNTEADIYNYFHRRG
jgi:Zn-dependent oligopeptidase